MIHWSLGRVCAGIALAIVGLTLGLRAALDLLFMLPAPVGDGILFLDAAANLCDRSFFGTELHKFDPAGQDRYVWHGFVAPWLYANLNLNCSAQAFFAIGLLIRLIGFSLAYALARRYCLPQWQALSLGLLTFATQQKLGFRPELVAIPIILAVELTIKSNRRAPAGPLMALLVWTQPTAFALYGLVLLSSRSKWLLSFLRPMPVAVSVLSFLFLLWVYPYPLKDLLGGIALQGAALASRQDSEGFGRYYVFTHFLPGWSLLLLASLLIIARHAPFVALIFPVLWWFGPRIPPTNYNLLVLLPVVACMASSAAASVRNRGILAALSLAIALIGLTQLAARDLATLSISGDTFQAAKAEYLRDLTDPALVIQQKPIFSGLWLADLRHQGVAKPEIITHSEGLSPLQVSYLTHAGRPRSPCPEQSPDVVPYKVAGLTIFNSTSGWQLYRCISKN